MSLESIQAAFMSSGKPDDEIQDMLEDEFETLLDDHSRAEVRGSIMDLEIQEFKEFAGAVFESYTAP